MLDFFKNNFYAGHEALMAFQSPFFWIFYLSMALIYAIFHQRSIASVLLIIPMVVLTIIGNLGLIFPAAIIGMLTDHYRKFYLEPTFDKLTNGIISFGLAILSFTIAIASNFIFYGVDNIFEFNPQSPLIFTKLFFWSFFAIVLTVYSSVYQKIGIRNAFLGIVSLFFYYKTSGLFFLLLVFSTVIDYWVGLKIDQTEKSLHRKMWLGLSLFTNLGTLIYFKYAYFFTDAYNQIFQTNYKVINWLAYWSNGYTGTHFDIDEIALPVGVSFFTFQTISYSIDVYRKHIKPVTNISDFSFYVAYFPQLVAGPIVRANEFVPQIYQPYHVTRNEMGLAIFWILNGLLKKMIIGDYMAVNFIDRVFDYPENYTGFGVLMALFTYSLQVYADFSGYTDIAIGVSILLGFRLPVNFNSPYKARNVAEFWKRWHISLSTWLKDYLYIPLGGNKKSSLGTYFWSIFIMFFVVLISGEYWWISLLILGGLSAITIILSIWLKQIRLSVITNINLMITMIIGGLWHGASWNFVIWGALNGVALVVYKVWKNYSPYENNQHWIITGWKVFFTFSFISFTRLFFRAGDIKNTGSGMDIVERMWYQLMNNWSWEATFKILENHWGVFIMFFIGMIIHWLPLQLKTKYRQWFVRSSLPVQIACSVGAVFLIYQFLTSDLQAFIYFQF